MSRRVPTPPTQEQLDARPPPPPIYIERRDEMNRLRAECDQYKRELEIVRRERDDAQDKNNQIRDVINRLRAQERDDEKGKA